MTIGVATEIYLNKMLAEPFPSFTFSPAGASVYQLGTFGTARKELKALAWRLRGADLLPDVHLLEKGYEADDLSAGIDRRALVSGLRCCQRRLLLSLGRQAQTTSNTPLPSWNEGAAKQAILDFVRATTDQASPKFVPPEDRVATFDQDGTLWVEHPIYTQVIYCLDRVPAVVEKKPQLKNGEPFKTVLSGDRAAIAKLPLHDLEEILVATLTGMPVETFQAEVKKWIGSAKHSRWKRPYTDLDLSADARGSAISYATTASRPTS